MKHLEEEVEQQVQRARAINIARKHLEKERDSLTKLLETVKAELAGVIRENELLRNENKTLQIEPGSPRLKSRTGILKMNL